MIESIMLEAIEHNWGLMGPEEWNTITWLINYDMSYTITVEYNPSKDPETYEDIPVGSDTVKRVMSNETFDALKKHLGVCQWRDPNIKIDACDGVAWEITYYSVDGKKINSSGKLDYIYGEKVLENIVSMLPETEEVYDSDACISVSRK